MDEILKSKYQWVWLLRNVSHSGSVLSFGPVYYASVEDEYVFSFLMKSQSVTIQTKAV